MRPKKNKEEWKADFVRNCQKMRAFQQRFDTTRIPNWVDGELSCAPRISRWLEPDECDPALCFWAKRQGRRKRKGTLEQDREEGMNAICHWGCAQRWDSMFEELKQHKEEVGVGRYGYLYEQMCT